MGYDAYAHTVYGKRVKKSDLTEMYQVRGCRHNIDTTQKFCPECGKPVFKVEEREVGILDSFPNSGELGKFYSDYESDYLVVGFALASTGYNSTGKDAFIPVREVSAQMKKDLIDFFSGNNLDFNEKDFQVYTFVHHSY